jgi:hypothetical protein
MSTILPDVAIDSYADTALDEDGADDAFMASLGFTPDGKDAPKKTEPSKEAETNEDETDTEVETNEDEGSEETPETDDDEGETEVATEGEEKAEDTKTYVDSDKTFVKIKQGGTEHEVKVSDLTRLFGQEAALTQKSQEVAAQRQLADTQIATNVAALNVLVEKAKEKAAPYLALDWLAISKNPNISAEEASALRDEAQRAIGDVNFLTTDLGNLMNSITEKQKADTAAQAKVCITALSTPGTAEKPNALHIEGWNDKVYDELRSFARALGADDKSVNAMVDPIAFKVLHMAMQFKRGASKVLTVKTNKSGKKIVKSSSSSTANRASPPVAAKNKALANLRRTGSEQSAEDAFLAGFLGKSDD